MKQLTQAEEQVMIELWKLKAAFVKDIITELPEPKPAYNTISTIIRILEKKGFVQHKAFGKSHQYFPIISKAEYRSTSLKSLIGKFFGSSSQLVSHLVKEENISLEEIDQLLKEEDNHDSH